MRMTIVRSIALVTALTGIVAGTAAGQLATRPAMTLEAAKTIADAAEAEARTNGWSVVIVIVDEGGYPLLLRRMDDVQRASLEIATQKARAAALFRRPTRAFYDRMAAGDPIATVIPGALPMIGGWPIEVGDVVVGAVGVSGVTGEQDEQIARAGVAALTE